MKQFLLAVFAVFLLMAGFSCNRGVGCPTNESLRANTNKKGEYKAKHTKSGLWSKKGRKKAKN